MPHMTAYRTLRRLGVTLGAALCALTIGAGAAHADTSTTTDACLDGAGTTVIIGAPCTSANPPASVVCARGWAHLTLGDHDYCTPPKVVTVGEYELGTNYVPRIFPGTRLDVVMGKGSTAAKRARCGRLGGSLVYSSKFKRWTCRGVDV